MTDLLEKHDVLNETEATQTPTLSVMPLAAAKIKELLQARNIPGYALRVFVAGGGCSGLQYGMAFEANPQDFDTLIETDGVRLIVDPTSLTYLDGATIDFVDGPMGGGFRIENPNESTACNCSSSGCSSCH